MGDAAKVVNFDRSDVSEKESTVPASVFNAPIKPEYLSDRASIIWDYLVDDLGRKHGIINGLDAFVLAKFCSIHARWVDAEIALDDHGMFQTSPNGYVQQSAEYNVWLTLSAQGLKFANKLGLTPPSRKQINAAESEKQDSFTDF